MNHRILIVDDDYALTTLFEYYLRSIFDGEIVCATNGLEAVKYCQKHTPDLILMDLHMPVMDGLTAIRKIRAMKIDAPIIVLSDYSFRDGEECLAAGANQVIQKPVREQRFYNLVGQYTPFTFSTGNRLYT